MVSRKAILALACGALAVPGIAQATHHTGKLGAPGQVCKPLHQQQAADLENYRAQNPAPSQEQVRTFRAMQRAAYKGCIQQAAKARSEDKQGGQNQSQSPNVNSKGAPGQVCKSLREARKAQLEAFRNQDPKPSKELVREFRLTQRAAYKGCIQGAAKARRQHNQQQHQNHGKHKGQNKS
jgi:hypothetical protein